MSASKLLTALAFLSATTAGYACDGIWQPNTSGNWSTGFSPCTPMVAGDTATFGTPPTGPVAVNVDISPVVMTLNFQNNNSYTLSGSTSISFTDTTTSINVFQGSHTINAGISLKNTTLTISSSAGTSLDTVNIVDSGNPSSIIFNGPGSFSTIRSDPATPALNSGISVSNPIILQNNANVTVGNAATFAGLFGSSSAINSTVTIDNSTLTVFNSADVTALGTTAIGELFNVSFPLTLNGGIIHVTNSGNISETGGGNGVGTVFVVSDTFTINGGTVLVDNVGTLTGNSIGSVIAAFNNININAGRLINNSLVSVGMGLSPGTIFVSPQGTIAGNGLYSFNSNGILLNMTIDNSGTLIPGDPVTTGTMTIQGSLIQRPTATFVENIINADQFGKVQMATNTPMTTLGDVTLAGTLGVMGLPHFSVRPGDTFTIIDAPGGVTGRFSSVSMLNNSSYIPMVFYSPTQVILALNAGSFPGIQQSLFTSINNTNIRLERELQHIRSRFPKEVPPDSRSAKQAPERAPYRLSDQRLAVIQVNNVNELKPSTIASQMQMQREQQRLSERVKYCVERPFNLYFGPIGTIGDYNTKRNQIGFSEWSAGALMGLDYADDEFGVGLQVEYERQHGHVHKHWGHFNVDQAHADLFATYVPSGAPKLAINGIVGGGYDWIRVHRKTGLSGSDMATGSTHTPEFDALFGLEYTIDVKKTGGGCSNIKFIPMVNLQYIYLNIDGYREHSAGLFDLTISGQKPQSLRSTLGAWVTDFWDWDDSRLYLTLDLAWQREYLDHGKKLHFATPNFAAPAGSMTAVGAGRNSLLVGLDLLYTMDDKYGIEGSYDYQWNNLFTDSSFYLGFNIRF